MIYAIRHLTAYSYDVPVAGATLALRLTPPDSAWQHRLTHRIAVAPTPFETTRETDFFGNAVSLVTIDQPHTELRIEATARVEVDKQSALVVPHVDWASVARDALVARDLHPVAPAHFLFASPRIAIVDDVTRYARDSFPPGGGIVEGCRDLMTRIKKDFKYKPQATEVSTSVAQAFAGRQGVCQDFAQIMIAGLRGLGLPAAYVSGYLRTIAPPGKERLVGADATHAWVSVWCGPHNGWLGFDPTNALQVGTDHIVLALGRDFSDVSPVHGVFVGSGAHQLKVEVDVTPVA